MMKKCPHCGEEYEDDMQGSEEGAAHEAAPGDKAEDFGERVAKAVVAEMKKGRGPQGKSAFEEDEEKWPA